MHTEIIFKGTLSYNWNRLLQLLAQLRAFNYITFLSNY